MPKECENCNYAKNCINGKFCVKFKRYVTYDKVRKC